VAGGALQRAIACAATATVTDSSSGDATWISSSSLPHRGKTRHVLTNLRPGIQGRTTCRTGTMQDGWRKQGPSTWNP
jgi:hypothetical protein